MTDLIERAKAALEGATPGPWEAARDGNWIWVGPLNWSTRVCRVVLYDEEEVQQTANARLITLSPDLARAFIAETERRERIEKAAGELAEQVQRVKDFRYDPNIGIEMNLLEEALARFCAIAEGRE